MKRLVWIGVVLMVLGIGALVIKRVTYQADSATVDLGPVELTATEQKTVDIPQAAGIAAISVGALLVVIGGLGSRGRGD